MTKASPVWIVARLAVAGATVAILVAILAPSALAASKKKVGVSLNGMPAGPLREAISDVLKHHGFEAVTPELSGDSEDALAAAARRSRLGALIVGEVRDGGKRVKLRVYGTSGDLIGEGSWSEAAGPKKLAASVERTLWARIGGAVSKARAADGEKGGKGGKAGKAGQGGQGDQNEDAPASGAPAAEETPTYSRSRDSDSEKDSEAEPPRKSKKRKHAPVGNDDAEVVEADGGGASGPAGTALDLAVGPRFVTRSLGWLPATNNQLRTYTLGLSPSVGAQIAWFPAAHVTGGWKSNLGIAGSIEYTPGLVSQTSDGSRYPTQESDFWGGARGRLLLGPVEAAATVGYGQHGFVFRSGGGANRANLADLPDVTYSYLRAGADFRVVLPAKFALMLGGAYRYAFSAGDQNYLVASNSFLPRATVMGFDVAAAVGYRFLSALEARVGFDLRRYMVNAHYQMGDVFAITGGTDQYVALWAHLAVLLDGAGAQRGASGTSGDDEDGEGSSPKKRKASPPREAETPSGSGDDE
jgi:hypothetical protein